MNVYEALVKAGKVEDNKTLLLLQLQNDEWTYTKDYNMYNDFKVIDNAKSIIRIIVNNNLTPSGDKWVDCINSQKYKVDQVYLDTTPHSGNYMLFSVKNDQVIPFIKEYMSNKIGSHNNYLLGVAFKTGAGDIKYLSETTGYEVYMIGDDGKMYNIRKISYLEEDDTQLTYTEYMEKYYSLNC